MSRQEKEVYEFGPFRIDVGERRLIQKGQNVSSLRNIPLPAEFEVTRRLDSLRYV
jgi:hypothetical protein